MSPRASLGIVVYTKELFMDGFEDVRYENDENDQKKNGIK